MTVAVPCANCGAAFEAGRGSLCPNCRGGFAPGEVRIPQYDPKDCIPINNAARRAQGLPEDPNEPTGDEEHVDDLVDRVARLFGGS